MRVICVVSILFLGGCSLFFPSGNSPPLHEAVRQRDLAAATALVEAGAKVNAVDSYGRSTLDFAAFRGQEAIVVMLLSHGADVHQRARLMDRRTPLHAAAQQGEKRIAELLLDQGADVNAIANGNTTPLHFAAWMGHPETVKLLIERGADVNAADSGGETALHTTHPPISSLSREDYVRIVRILVDAGADVNRRSRRFNCTPLSDARLMESDEAVRILLEAGARD